MTFCTAMKLRDGLVALADTQITTGNERTTSHKISIHQYGRHSLFLMTSGLRTVRDKAVTYFDEMLDETATPADKMYKAVNQLAQQVRRVAAEDKKALEEANVHFDLQAIVGGQLERDNEHKLFLLYPLGNWVEITAGTPYTIIGESCYGKSLLDFALQYDSTLETGLKVGYLAFEATRASSVDVGFPIDVLVYKKDSFVMVEHRYDALELATVSQWWAQLMQRSVHELPDQWVADVMERLPRE